MCIIHAHDLCEMLKDTNLINGFDSRVSNCHFRKIKVPLMPIESQCKVQRKTPWLHVASQGWQAQAKPICSYLPSIPARHLYPSTPKVLWKVIWPWILPEGIWNTAFSDNRICTMSHAHITLKAATFRTIVCKMGKTDGYTSGEFCFAFYPFGAT